MLPRCPVWTNRAASGMWYQGVSARSMPAATLPSVGTIHAAASAARTATARSLAMPDEGGAEGDPEGATERLPSHHDASSAPAMPVRMQTTRYAPFLNSP